MPKRSKTNVERAKLDNATIATRLIGFFVVRGIESDQAVLTLSGAGFDDKTISEMLYVSESTIRGIRFRANKPKKKSKPK